MNRTAGPVSRPSRNNLAYGGTLVAALGIGLLVRLSLVRLLGPAAFGEMHVAENAAELLFIVLTLGVDTTLRRAAATEPARARHDLFDLLALRLVVGVTLVVIGVAWFVWRGHTTIQISTFALLGLAQILLTLNNSYSAVEHASGSVGWIMNTTIGFKLLWAALAAAVLLIVPAAVPFAAVLLLTETLRFARLSSRVIRKTGAARPDMGGAITTAIASVPLAVTFVASSACTWLGTWWLGISAGPREVGWYGAASAVAGVAMVGMPIVSWVLVPSAARAANAAGASTAELLGRVLRMTLLASVPSSIFLAIWAPDLLATLFGEAFLPATLPLRLLAMSVGLGGVATVCSISLIQQRRMRALGVVSAGGLVVSLALNAVLIPWGQHRWGGGGAASGAALATFGTEALAAALLLHLAWDRAWAAPLGRAVAGLAVGGLLVWRMARLIPFPALETSLVGAACFVCVLLAARTVRRADFASPSRLRPTEAPRAPLAT